MKQIELGELILERENKKIYHNHEDDLLIKVFNHEKVSKSEVLFEALHSSYIENIGLNVPVLKEVFPVDDDYALAFNFIKGETLQEKMDKDPKNKKKYIETLVKLQLEVLSKSVPALPKLKDKLNAKISFCGKDQAKIKLDATVRYDLHVRLEGMKDHTKLCHGDFIPSNIICGDDGKYYILDWAHACKGNASADAARTYLQFVIDGDQKAADEYLKIFCKKADIAIQYVQNWISVIAATLLNSVKGDEDKIAILLKNINVVEFC